MGEPETSSAQYSNSSQLGSGPRTGTSFMSMFQELGPEGHLAIVGALRSFQDDSLNSFAAASSALHLAILNLSTEYNFTRKAGLRSSDLKAWIEKQPSKPMPSCHLVKVAMSYPSSLDNMSSHLLPFFKRMSGLRELWTGGITQHNLPQMLQIIQQHLPDLKGLHITSNNSWAEAADIWQQLAAMTNLTSLFLYFEREVWRPYSYQDLSPLGQLTALTSLTLFQPSGTDYAPGPPQLDFLQQLARLRSLTISIEDEAAMSCIGTLQELTELRVIKARSVGLLELSGASSVPLAKLTNMEALTFANEIAFTDTTLLDTALPHLTRLSYISMMSFAQDTARILAQLPELLSVKGSWEDGPAAALSEATRACSRVTHLEGGGELPFQFFPALKVFDQAASISTAAMARLGHHCGHFERLQWTRSAPHGVSMSAPSAPDQPSPEAALYALRNLHHFSSFALRLSTKSELAAACAASSCAGFRILSIKYRNTQGPAAALFGGAALAARSDLSCLDMLQDVDTVHLDLSELHHGDSGMGSSLMTATAAWEGVCALEVKIAPHLATAVSKAYAAAKASGNRVVPNFVCYS